jgi:hypothetical protein
MNTGIIDKVRRKRNGLIGRTPVKNAVNLVGTILNSVLARILPYYNERNAT